MTCCRPLRLHISNMNQFVNINHILMLFTSVRFYHIFKIHWSQIFKIQNALSSDCTSSPDPHQCNTVLSDNPVVSRILAILPAAQNPSSQNHAAATEALPSHSSGRRRSHRREIGVYLYVGQVVLQAHSDNYVLPKRIWCKPTLSLRIPALVMSWQS
jgi:hypothetical protein